MKRRNRQISIFSMSALDLFASALGAFILIAIVMFPYFSNTGTADQRELRDARDALERERRRKFLLVTISWDDGDDVDLHVVDPAGNEFSYLARTHAGTPARFEEDAQDGPGNEMWLHPRVTPGAYRIYYNLFEEKGGAGVSVRGAAVHSIDRIELPPRRLTREGERTLVATVVVDADVNVEVRRHEEADTRLRTDTRPRADARPRPEPEPPAGGRPGAARPPGGEAARPGCGDERDRLIREYVEHGLRPRPGCGDLSSRGGSAHFSFSELNRNPDYRWAWITSRLLSGLERTRRLYGRPLTVTSGYRNPERNLRVGGVRGSRHQFGRAVDVSVPGVTEAEIKAIELAADRAGASYTLDYSRHVHAHWD